jgi:hypothetical protein
MGSSLTVVATRAHGICAMVSENETGYTFNYNLESFSKAMGKAIAVCQDEKTGDKQLPDLNQVLESYQWHKVNERLTKDIVQIL